MSNGTCWVLNHSALIPRLMSLIVNRPLTFVLSPTQIKKPLTKGKKNDGYENVFRIMLTSAFKKPQLVILLPLCVDLKHRNVLKHGHKKVFKPRTGWQS